MSPRGDLSEIAKLRQVLAKQKVHLVLLTEPHHADEPPNAERRSWAIRHHARMQVLPLADIRSAAQLLFRCGPISGSILSTAAF